MGAVRSTCIAEHVHGDPAPDDVHGAHAVHRLLHLAVTPVGSLDRVGGGGKKRFVEERQCLVHGGRKQLLKCLPYRLEATSARTQSCELTEGRIGSTAAVEEPIDLVHDIAEDPEGWQAPTDPLKRLGLGGREVMLNEEMAALEESGDLCLEPFPGQGAPRGLAGSRTPARRRRNPGPDGFADLGHCPQDCQGDVGDDVELADLVRHVAKDIQNRLRIHGRTVGRDPLELQTTAIEDPLESSEEVQHVLVRWVVVEDVVDEPLEAAVVHDRQHAKRTIVEFVGSDVSGELAKSPIQVVSRDARFAFFSPTPRPSSGLWRMARRPDGLAKGARRPIGTRARPRRPGARLRRPLGGCSCFPAARGPTCRR